MALDFSHLFDELRQPAAVVRYADMAGAAADEMFLEALETINPPLLEPREHATVTAMLGRKRGRRPSRGVPSIKYLSRRIAGLDRPDVDPEFLGLLADRLANDEGLTDAERAWPLLKAHRRRQRNVIIRGIYEDFHQRLENGPSSIDHEIFGKLVAPTHVGTRRYQAAELTRQVLSGRLREIAPSITTIIKIASMIH